MLGLGLGLGVGCGLGCGLGLGLGLGFGLAAARLDEEQLVLDRHHLGLIRGDSARGGRLAPGEGSG